MRIALLFLILRGFASFAQTITGAAVDSAGWFVKLYVTGLNTNGTYALGWASDNKTGANGLTMAFNSTGYDDSGGAVIVPKTAFGTKQLRIAGTPLNDETPYSGGIILKFGLSEWVYSGDTNFSLTTTSGIYSQGGSNLTSVSSMVVTNESSQIHPKVVANWSWPGFQHITSSTVTQRVVAYHQSANSGRPVRAIRFGATDGTNATYVWSTRPIIDSTIGGAIKVPEYVGVFDLSSFPQPNFIRFDFAAFPWVGDTNAVVDTATTGFSMPDPRPSGITNLIDSASAFKVTRAIVATNGNSATGVAANPTYWSTNSSPPAFATIGAALQAIAATNNAQHGFNRLDAAEVLLNEGDHGWMGASCTIAAGPRCFVTIRPNTGAARENVRLTTAATDSRCTDDLDMYRISNVTFDTSSGTMFVRVGHLWLDQCAILNATASAFFQQSASAQLMWYITRSTVSNLTQGVRSFSIQRLAPAIVRGNTFNGTTEQFQAFTFLGNHKTVAGSTQARVVTEIAGAATPVGWGQIIGYNRFDNCRFLGNILECGIASNIVVGLAIVNNVFEQSTNNTASTAYYIASANTLNHTNLMFWNNTMVGTKLFYGYNDAGTAVAHRWLWSSYNNIFDDYNLKGDTFSPTNANRVGNWPVSWGTASAGNAALETAGVGAPGDFLPEFQGEHSWNPGQSATISTNYPVFLDRLAYDGVNVMPGGGDYKLRSNSPLWNRNYDHRTTRTKWILSHDMNGLPRGELDPPGAYTEGSARKGSFQ